MYYNDFVGSPVRVHTMRRRDVITVKAANQRAITAAWKRANPGRNAGWTSCGSMFEYDGRMYLRVVYLHGFANGRGPTSACAHTWVHADDVYARAWRDAAGTYLSTFLYVNGNPD